jgi:hypothetical protein
MRRYVSLFTNILIVEWRESMREIIQGWMIYDRSLLNLLATTYNTLRFRKVRKLHLYTR